LIVLLGLAAGCDSLWPLEGTYDPRRCDPICPAGQRCLTGYCMYVDLGQLDAGPDGPTPDLPLLDALPDAPPDAPALDGPPDAAPADAALPGTWVLISAGTFSMGSPATEPCRESTQVKETQHSVTLTTAFYIMASEVTQDHYKAVTGSSSQAKNQACGGPCPMETVTWHEAVAYCNALSTNAGLTTCYSCGSGAKISCTTKAIYSGSKLYACPGYRLPTEAEWEYAYRAGSTSAIYPTSASGGTLAQCKKDDPNLSKIAWYAVNTGAFSMTAKGKLPNAWGLYDMAGNVAEWTQDWYLQDLGSAPQTDPVNVLGPTAERIVRGGDYGSLAQNLRAASRWAHQPDKPIAGIGFRCVRSTSP
jgi:formylglycine-generating enzyme required for sulfatase activity